MEIDLCVCGAKAEIGWSGCAETSIGAWQSVWIKCTNPKCLRDIDIGYYADQTGESVEANAAIVIIWNLVFGKRSPACCTTPAPCDRAAPAVTDDTRLMDFLADPSQDIANVQLPRHIVERNVHSLRDAIADTMAEWKASQSDKRSN